MDILLVVQVKMTDPPFLVSKIFKFVVLKKIISNACSFTVNSRV